MDSQAARQKVVVIGNGMVGHKFLEALAASDRCSEFEVVTFCEEPRPAYDRVHLTEFFSGRSADDLSLVQQGFFEQNGITLHLNDRAVAIDRENRLVRSAGGREQNYDKLILATGS